MGTFRISRTSEDVKRELTHIMTHLKDPRITGMISIVKVDLAGDYSHCKVYVSSLEGIESARHAVEGLNNAAGFIRREIGTRIQMRRTPSFQFIADDSIAHSADISRILQDILPEDKKEKEDQDAD